MPRRFSIVFSLCALVALIALAVLGGWLFDISRLRTFGGGWSPIAPLTVVMLLLVSLGSLTFYPRPRIANVALTLALAIGALVLINYFTGISFGLASFSRGFQRSARAPIPELPAPDASAAFILLAVAFFCLRSNSARAHDTADVFAAAIAVVCLEVLVAFVYQFVFSDDRTGFRQIAPHTTFAVILLAVTVVAQRPTPGLYRAMTGPSQSALLLRRLLPITVFSCLLVGFLEVEAIRAHVGGTLPDIVAWSVTFTIIVIAILLFATSMGMRQAEATVHQREQELVRANDAAISASNTKSRFMAVMSHELRTPLTGILGYADMLEAGVAGPLTPEARKFVSRIRTSGWHLVGLIDAVLLYASGRPAHEQVRNEPLDLIALLHEIISDFEAQAADKRIDIAIDHQTEQLMVWSDPSRLREVLNNLIGNSVKFTEAGGVTVRALVKGDDVTVEIIDTGIGIDEKFLSRIWEPFEQQDDPHTRERGGMGLGMALTRMLCDQMNVPINVESRSGAGTTITLRLRRRSEEEGTPRLAGVRLLVVDDDANVRRIMVRSLQRSEAAVTEAGDAAEALRHINSNHAFDAVVTDISMPGMSGIELAQTLTKRFPTLPMLFVTGAELSPSDQSSIDALGIQVLYKPFDMRDLTRVIFARLNSIR